MPARAPTLPSAPPAPSPADAKSAIASYTSAVERRLRPTLDAAIASRDAAYASLAEAERMSTSLDVLDVAARSASADADATTDEYGEGPAALSTRVDIGENFYADAVVRSLEPVVVDVGLGVLVEMSRVEAREAVRRRKEAFEREAARQNETIASVRACLGGVLSRVELLARGTEMEWG